MPACPQHIHMRHTTMRTIATKLWTDSKSSCTRDHTIYRVTRLGKICFTFLPRSQGHSTKHRYVVFNLNAGIENSAEWIQKINLFPYPSRYLGWCHNFVHNNQTAAETLESGACTTLAALRAASHHRRRARAQYHNPCFHNGLRTAATTKQACMFR